MTKLTPEQAFAAVKVLWPHVEIIRRRENRPACIFIGTYSADLGIEIDWHGLDRYPPPEKKWRPAEWPRDASNPPKKCRIKDTETGDWYECVLWGFKVNIDTLEVRWITDAGHARFCEVEDDS